MYEKSNGNEEYVKWVFMLGEYYRGQRGLSTKNTG